MTEAMMDLVELYLVLRSHVRSFKYSMLLLS